MNRRGFFGALAALPLVRKVAPPPVREFVAVNVPAMGGLAGWIPDSPPGDAFFGVDRTVDPRWKLPEAQPFTQAGFEDAVRRLLG